MHITLPNIQNGTAVQLPEPIDNRCGQLRVALRQLTYVVGWYNIPHEDCITWRVGKSEPTIIKLSPGLWSFQDLKPCVENAGAQLAVNLTNGLIKLVVPEGREILFSDEVLTLLGLDDGRGGVWLKTGLYDGDRPVNFSPFQSLGVHLYQLSTSDNLVGAYPSTLLASVSVGPNEFGSNVSVHFDNPPFKKLQAGTINELNLWCSGGIKKLDNHGLPISALIEIA